MAKIHVSIRLSSQILSVGIGYPHLHAREPPPTVYRMKMFSCSIGGGSPPLEKRSVPKGSGKMVSIQSEADDMWRILQASSQPGEKISSCHQGLE